MRKYILDSVIESNTDEEEIDLKELLVILWEGKVKILIFTFLVGVSSMFYALSIPDQFKASVLLAPSQQEANDLSKALGQVGGLASLAGVNVGGQQINESLIAQEIMKSWSFIEKFVRENDIGVEIHAAESWSSELNKLVYAEDVFDFDKDGWIDGKKPSSWDTFTAFRKRLDVVEDLKTGLVSVSIEFYSPVLAKKWLDLFILSINAHMQERQIEKVANNIEYLQTQVEKTSIAEMQEVLYTIIGEQIKNKMLAEASPDYAFVPVSYSMIPEQASQPKRILILLLGCMLGGLLSVMWILASHFRKKSDR